MTRLDAAVLRKMRLHDEKKGKRVPNPVTLPLVKWDAKLFIGGVWIQVPFSPPSLNEWKNWHWAKQRKYKDDLSEAISDLVMCFKLPKFKYATVQVIHYFKTNRLRDPSDNYAPKFLMDALVRAGILVDDNGKLVKVPTPEILVDKERPRTEVFIWERKQ